MMTTNNVNTATTAHSDITHNAMKKSRGIAIAILAVLFLIVGAVFLRLYQVSQRAPIYDGNPIYEEAKEQSQKFWDTMLVRCGDSYYGVLTRAGEDVASTRWIFQLREPEIVVYYDPKQELTNADKLNGVEFDGKTFISASASRSYQDGKWSVWSDGATAAFHETISTPVRKVKGRWQFGIGKESRIRLTPTTCGTIPK
jgi:hypothetical protein